MQIRTAGVIISHCRGQRRHREQLYKGPIIHGSWGQDARGQCAGSGTPHASDHLTTLSDGEGPAKPAQSTSNIIVAEKAFFPTQLTYHAALRKPKTL